MSGPRLWTPGFDWERTGIGVIQRRLVPGLETRGWNVSTGTERPERQSLRYKAAQLMARAPRDADVSLLLTTPAPLRLDPPVALMVYDLRWLRTASRAKRTVRDLDLRRTLRRADLVFAISERTVTDLHSHIGPISSPVVIVPLGPGIFDEVPATPARKAPGSVLLVGGAGHKRNELAIEALHRSRSRWFQTLVGVGLSKEATLRAVDHFGHDRCQFHTAIDADQMRAAFSAAEVFISLSVEEGFGFPYLEALAAGCHVVAIDQALTREILDDAAVLVEDGSADALASQLSTLDDAWPPAHVRRAHAQRYSWADSLDAVDFHLRRLLD